MRGVMTGVILAAATATLIAISAAPAAARNYVYETKYCAREYDGAMDCSYFTLRQCLAAMSATGGDCAINPRYVGEPPRLFRKAARDWR